MSYERYKKKLSKENFFETWEDKESLTDSMKGLIYDKYLLKCDILKRDNFSCQNIECKNSNSPLTIHHVKFQKNGGKNSLGNCVTLCRSCHRAFHRAKRDLVFPDSPSLPTKIRGHTFRLDVPDVIDWKAVRKEMKQLRKKLKTQGNLSISWEEVSLLMKWLYTFHENDDD